MAKAQMEGPSVEFNVPLTSPSIDSLQSMRAYFAKAGTAVQLPDDQNMSFAEVVEQSLQLWSIPARAGQRRLSAGAGLFLSNPSKRSN
jgi:hypothetical protein